jgi:hypothetical protein
MVEDDVAGLLPQLADALVVTSMGAGVPPAASVACHLCLHLVYILCSSTVAGYTLGCGPLLDRMDGALRRAPTADRVAFLSVRQWRGNNAQSE